MDSIDLTPSQRKTVVSLLSRYIPGVTVWAYGSRVKWTSRPDSDLDLVVFTAPEQRGRVSALKEAFEESSLPFRVDVMIWDEVPGNFRKNILEQYVVLVEKPAVTPENHARARDWKVLPLEDCMSAIIDYRGKTPNKTSSGIPLVTAKVVKGGKIETPDEFIAIEDFESWMRRGMPMAGDVVMTTEAPLGEIAQLGPERVALAQRLITLRGKPNILDNTFLKFLMQSPDVQDQLHSRASGTTVLGIKQSELRKIKLILPPIPEQRAIAHVLGTLDDKIELNRRMNETLEAMARALFKDWFVDFGPTRTKMEGREPYLAPEFWAFFPDRLDDGGKPEGWEAKRVEDVLELAYGKALKANDRVDGPIPVYGSGGVTGYHNTALVDGPSVIVGRKGTVGSLYWEDHSFFPIDTVFYVKPKTHLTFCFYLLQTLGLEEMNTDAAVPGLNRNNVYRLPVIWASDKIRQVFDETVWSLRQRMRACMKESNTLAQTRDLLLPKLMSGEIQIKEAEKIVKGAP